MTSSRSYRPRALTALRGAVAVLVLAVVVVAAGTAPVPATAAQGEGGWPAFDAPRTGEFRSWLIEDGELVYSNGVYQARGANTDGLHHEDYWGPLVTGGELPIDERDDVERHLTWGAFGLDRWATDGDYEWPRSDDWPEFTGEIAELRLAVHGDDVAIRFRFTSMPRPDSQIATLTFAPAPNTGAEAPAATTWPHGAGVTSPWTVAVTTWGTGGTIATADGEPVPLADVGGAVRTGDHTVDVRIPRRLLPDGPWLLTGGAGLADPEDPSAYWPVPAGSATADAPGSGSSTTTGPAVWSLLFADDDPWVFTARTEGDLLADGDVSAAALTLDPGLLTAGASARKPARSGRLARFHESAFDFGDGIAKGEPGEPPLPTSLPPEVPLDDAARNFEYLGRLQPYGMLVPEAYQDRTGPWPLILYLHGLNNFYYEPFGVLPNLDEVVTGHGYLFAGLLGRGDLSYLGRGEVDVLEVLADIRAHYDVDPDRVYLMGHSMGSIGTHNVATRNPDLFAAVAPSEIAASEDLLLNLRHVPWLMMAGLEDPLDPGAESAMGAYETLSAFGYDATLYTYLTKTHESSATYDTLPQILGLFDASRRPSDPAEIVYRRLPGDDDPDLGLVHDGVYGVDGLAFADSQVPQTIRVESLALRHERLDPAAAGRTDEQVDEGGPSGRTAARKQTTTPAYESAPGVRNAVRVGLDNVAAATLDTADLGLRIETGLTLEADSDQPATVTLTGAAAGTWTVEVDGETSGTVTVDGGRLALDIPLGEHTIVLAAESALPSPPLPVTGGSAVTIALGLLGLAVLSGGRGRWRGRRRGRRG